MPPAQPMCPRRTVLTGIPFCIAGVVLVARPPFLFGGAGIPTLGIAVALAQCTFSAAVKLLVRELRTTEQTNVGRSAMSLLLPVLPDCQQVSDEHVAVR
jgi:drug/metabolite transporter (DMT)-like permease